MLLCLQSCELGLLSSVSVFFFGPCLTLALHCKSSLITLQRFVINFLQTVSCSSTFLADSSRSRLLWNRTVQGAEDASSDKTGIETGFGFRPSLVGKPNLQLTKKYQCPYCGKRFSATSNLRGHLVHHTGIKEFVCTICKKEFQYKQALKRHSVKCFQEMPQMSFNG